MTAFTDFSDVELVAMLKNGDHGAYSEIYRRYHAALYIHVFNKLRLREESRDIVHDLFASLWSKCQDVEIKGNLSTYLYVSARYKIFDFIAHRVTNSRYLSSIREYIEKDTYISDYLVREKELQAIIDREIQALPSKMRQIFELSRKQHLSHKAIAELLDLSEKTVKKQVNNALKVLRGKLGNAMFLALLL